MATAKEWNMYQVSKALLRREQQNVLTLCERYMYLTDPDYPLAGFDVSNDKVNDLRGGEYTPAENELFLNELAKVNLYAKNKLTVQNPFDSVKLHDRHGKNIFSIRFSDYFLKLIGGYIRDNWGELYDQH